jgi:hypothetical protein
VLETQRDRPLNRVMIDPPMLECPRCRWHAAAPPNWVAPFAICPRCEAKIANPDAAAAARTSAPPARGGDRRLPPQQKMPAGYQFTYSESGRRTTDAWIKNFSMIALAVAAVVGCFWAISKRQSNSKTAASEGIYEMLDDNEITESPINNTPFSNTKGPEIGDDPLPGVTGVHPSGSTGWDDSPVFQAPGSPLDNEDSLWDATSPAEEPLAPAPSAPSAPFDPAIPSFEGFK